MNPDAEIPAVYADNVAVADDPLSLDPATIAAERSDWVDRWTTLVLR